MIFEVASILAITVTIYLSVIYAGELRFRRNLHEQVKLRLAPNLIENNASQPVLKQVYTRFTTKRASSESKLKIAAQLPELFDVLTIGFRSGLTLNACFGLYIANYQNELSSSIQDSYLAWNKGMISADSALDAMGEQVRSPLFDRFKLLAKRSVKYGISITNYLGEFAQSARQELKAEVETRIAKTPVKMLIPTSVLILPAMLLLVLGPILLDMGGKMT